MMKTFGSLFFAALLVVAGGVAYAFWDSATAQADDNTVSAGSLNLELSDDDSTYAASVSDVWELSGMAPGDDVVSGSVWMRNVGDVDTDQMDFGVSITSQSPNTPPIVAANQFRVTELTYAGESLLSGGAGAAIGLYELFNPLACDIQVNYGSNDYDRVSEAVDAAAAGSVICVGPGNYSEAYESAGGGSGYPISVDEDNVILVASADPFSGDVTALQGAVNVTGTGVTVAGFEITDPDGSYGVSISGGASDVTVAHNYIHNIGSSLANGSAQGISLQNGNTNSSGFAFTNNTIMNIGNLSLKANGGSSAKGIYLGDTAATGIVDDVLVENNHIETIQASTDPWVSITAQNGRGAYGILTNVDAGVTNLVVRHNTITNLEGLWSHAIGLERLTDGALVELNDISEIVNHKISDDSVGVMVEDNVGTGIVVTKNNFTPNVAFGVLHAEAGGASVDATNNWWGDFNPSDQVYTVGPMIDTSSFAGGPFIGFFGGVDGSNANGFADLADFAELGIEDVTPGLVAGGASEELVMALQLDGPSTGNEFQGATVSFNMEITTEQLPE